MAGVAKRLQARLDQQLRLLGELHPEPSQLRALTEVARRMRRDAASIVLLSGEEPGGQASGPRRLSEVLDEAASAAEETWRILVRPAAIATVEPAAAVEFVYLLAEVLDHVTAAYPDAGIDVASYVTAYTGLTVEVSVNSASRFAPDGLGTQRAAAAAEAHAQRSRTGLALTLPTGALPAGGNGVVATVSCPPQAITLDEPSWSSTATAGRHPLAAVAPTVPAAVPPAGSNGHGNGHPVSNGVERGYRDGIGTGNGRAAHHGTNGSVAAARIEQPAAPDFVPVAPDLVPAPSRPVDELFGPMVDLPAESATESGGTPIFAAIASAWFIEDQPGAQQPEVDRAGAGPLDWESPSDSEWRAAAARVAQPDPLPETASGLPRRRPGNQLVPPPVQRPAGEEPTEREPDRVRNRLSTYQRGLRQGRHRAPGPDDRW